MSPQQDNLDAVFHGCLTDRLAACVLPESIRHGALMFVAKPASGPNPDAVRAWQLFGHESPKKGGYFVPCAPSDAGQCRITMAADDFLALGEGTLNLQMAFMKGRIKVAGDVSCAMELGALFG